jgi:signal transduction histidine kinase
MTLPGQERVSNPARKGGAFRFRSLRGRFVLYFIAVTILSLLLLGAIFASLLQHLKVREERRAKEELASQALEMAGDLELYLSRNYPGFPEITAVRVSQLLRLETRLIKAHSLVVNGEGEVVAPRPLPAGLPSRIPAEFLAPELGKYDADVAGLGRSYLVSVPLNVQEEQFSHLVVMKPSGELTFGFSKELVQYLLLAGGISLAVSVLLALYLSERILKPVRRLTQAAWDLAHGRAGTRVEVEGEDEIAQLASYFNYMADRVELNARLQRDFVANVSHEIRTPLTSIEGFTEALLDGTAEEGDRERYLRIIKEEAGRLKRVLQQLLALSRIDAGAWPLDLRPLEPRGFLEDLVQGWRSAAAEKGIELRLETQEGLPFLLTDRDTLSQILHNLLDNAVKFTPPGGVVTVSAGPAGEGELRFRVADTGPGIPADFQDRVFERFSRAEKSRNPRFGGAGLGLSLCRELVQLLGGRITFQSEEGKGTVFAVTLPLSREDHPSPEALS